MEGRPVREQSCSGACSGACSRVRSPSVNRRNAAVPRPNSPPRPRYNPPRSPGRGSVWQSTWFGIRGSQVQILPPRRGPSPRTGSGPEAATASGCFGCILFPPLPTQEAGGHFGTHPWLKPCIFRRSCRRCLSRRVPFFLLLLLDILKSDVMELGHMFAPSAPAHLSVRMRSEFHFAGFLPLDPVAHILSARLAGAGTRRFTLSYQRWE